jgi:phosphatidylcholine synthase
MVDDPIPPAPVPGPPALVAWLVHILTAGGAVLALLALVAIEEEKWVLALLWLFVALVIDGVDGSLARWARVKERAPRVDGETLDLVVDFLTYVFIPTVFIWRAGLVPPSYALWLAAAILLSSLYLFSRTDMKTPDGYFRGFPALWNLVAFYLYTLQASALTGALVVGVLVALTFAPVHFVHPFRVRDYGLFLPLLAAAWAASTVALLWPGWSGPARGAWLIVSVGTAAGLLALGFARTLRGERGGGAARGRA